MKKSNKLYQRVLALVLAVMLCVGMMPMAVFAVGGCSAHRFGSRQEDPNTGRPYVVCKICGQTCTQVDESGEHKCFNKIVFATCDKEGYTEYYCTECGYYETETFSDKLGHEWGGWTVERPATTAEEGLEKRVCNRDKSHVETRAIPKLEQNFFELKISYYDIDDGKFIADGDTHGHIAEGAVITGDQYLKDIPSGYEYANKLEGLDPGNKMPAHDTNLKVFCKKEATEPSTPEDPTLTVQYWDVETGKELQAKEEQRVKPGADISDQVHADKTPDPNYYLVRVDGPKVMPEGNAVLNAYYAPYRYTVTIHYLEEGTGNILRAKAEISVKKGESISKDSPEIPGYTPDKGKVEFDNIQEDKTATVWYSLTQIGYKYTVSWFDRETGKKIKDSVVRSIEAGEDIRIDSNADKTIEGYTFCPDDSDLYVPAENVAANGSTELKLVFTKNYTVTYNSNDGTNKTDPTTVVTSGTDVILKTLEQLGWETREGWRFLGWREEGAENVLDSTLKIVKDMNLFAVWEQIDYTVTYTDGVDGEEIFRDQEYSGLEAGVNTPAFDGTPSREGYTFAGWSPAVAETVTGDAIYTAVWERDITPPGPTQGPTSTPTPTPTPSNSPEPSEPPTDIPDPEPPLTESPDVTPTPSTPPVSPDPEPPVEIPDDDPPLAEIPDEDPPLAEIPDDLTEIEDEVVPLADVPKTGDDAKIWLTLALLSAAGLGVIGLMQRRTRKNGRDS